MNALRRALKIADGEAGDFILRHGVLRFGFPVSVVQALWLNAHVSKTALLSREHFGTLPTFGFAWILFVHLTLGAVLGKHFGKMLWSLTRADSSR